MTWRTWLLLVTGVVLIVAGILVFVGAIIQAATPR